MNKSNYISATEFQNWNPETDFSAYSAPTLSGMITRAADWVDEFLGYSLKVEDISNELSKANATPDGDLLIFTKKIPIISVSGIALKLGTFVSSLSLEESDGSAKYDIPEPNYHIRYPYSQIELSGTVSISDFFQTRSRHYFVRTSYKAGYYTIPSTIKDAINLVAKDIFMRQTNPMDLSSVSQGAIRMAYRKQEGGKSDFIKDAIRLLEPFRKRHY